MYTLKKICSFNSDFIFTYSLKFKLMSWRTLNGNFLSSDIHSHVEAAIIRETNAGNKLKVCIGSDSQVYTDYTEFATVIVFLREKRGGFMFIKNERDKNTYQLKERMLLEVSKSIETAYSLCDLFNDYSIDMEVHVDINTNPNFESNIALKDSMGYILGMGFAFKAKPEAFASSSCADRAVH